MPERMSSHIVEPGKVDPKEAEARAAAVRGEPIPHFGDFLRRKRMVAEVTGEPDALQKLDARERVDKLKDSVGDGPTARDRASKFRKLNETNLDA